MKIGFVRSGGFAGLRLALELDTADLPAEQAAHLARLVEAARRTLVDSPRARPGPDRFEYHLTIDSPTWGQETHVLCEPDVPESVRPLLEQLTAMARRNRA